MFYLQSAALFLSENDTLVRGCGNTIVLSDAKIGSAPQCWALQVVDPGEVAHGPLEFGIIVQDSQTGARLATSSPYPYFSTEHGLLAREGVVLWHAPFTLGAGDIVEMRAEAGSMHAICICVCMFVFVCMCARAYEKGCACFAAWPVCSCMSLTHVLEVLLLCAARCHFAVRELSLHQLFCVQEHEFALSACPVCNWTSPGLHATLHSRAITAQVACLAGPAHAVHVSA